MRKWSYLLVAVVGFLFLSIGYVAIAQDPEPFPYCTDTPKYCQEKIAQVPIPWQFWAIDTTTGEIIDRIRISPTWLNPPEGQPVGAGPIFVRRQFALVPGAGNVVPLDDLVWDFTRNMPAPQLDWQMVDDAPVEVVLGEDLELRIPLNAGGTDPGANNTTNNTDGVGAVLVAYEVMLGPAGPAVSHFLNEAVLESQSPLAIVQVMVNFDVHNDTGQDVTNFELDFQGLDFDCEDVLWALGFVAGQGMPPVPVPMEPWGANEENPLIVRPIVVSGVSGTEVKWIQPDRPLEHCEWLHGGLSFSLVFDSTLNATVQGYWTIIVPCPVDIDIKPGSDPNSINPGKKGVIPVAILSTDTFDATQVDADTVRFGPDGAEKIHEDAHLEDVDGDGDIDMVLHFETKETGIAKGDTEAELIGETVDGVKFSGVDSIKTPGKP